MNPENNDSNKKIIKNKIFKKIFFENFANSTKSGRKNHKYSAISKQRCLIPHKDQKNKKPIAKKEK